MTNELKGQVAVVTGAGRGIGRALGTRLAAEGMKVGLLSRTGAEVDALRDEITANGGEALSFTADVASPADVDRVIGEVVNGLGPVDVLVNNAARSASWNDERLWDADPDEWWSRVETNLRGPMLFARGVLPSMIERGHGYVMAMNSLAGAAAIPNTDGAYPVSKSGMFRLTDQLAATLKGTGVVAIDLSPGLVRSSSNDNDELPEFLWTPVERICDLVVRVAQGEFDELAGRFIHATDDFDEVKKRIPEILENDGRVLRMRPGWEDDTKMKPTW